MNSSNIQSIQSSEKDKEFEMDEGYVFINLMPFRQQIKKEQLKIISIIVGFFVLVAGLIVFGIYSFLTIQNEMQERRNNYIVKQGNKLDEEIKDIKNLQEQINSTLEKRKVVERLQNNRGNTVKLFNEISRSLPDGALLTGVTSREEFGKEVVTLIGKTSSNNKVSSYMTQLVDSGVFERPILNQIKASKAKSDNQLSDFEIRVNVVQEDLDEKKTNKDEK